MRLDLDPNTEEQRPIKQSFCGSLRRDTHWKCLILSLLICGCLAAIAWCRLTVVTRDVINFYEMPITQTAYVSPCDDGYIYIPVAFVVMLYLVYLVECWHSHTRIELQYKVDVNSVYDRIHAMREALPIVWWKSVCYHYVRRTRQVTRYRNGDAFTTTQVYYERVNSHTASSAFNFSHCGIKDISKNLVNLDGYPATKIKFSKGFSFATVEAENEFEDQRAQFFHEHERRDDYMETREGLDLLNVNFKEYMIAFADPDNLPWYVSHIVFWVASLLMLSWPLRVCIEFKTAYVHYHVHKLFGCNYLDPSYCPGTMSRVSTMGSSELEMNIRNNYTLVPSYSEALLMENCYTQQQARDPSGSVTPSSIGNGILPGVGVNGAIPNGVAIAIPNGHLSLANGGVHISNGHAGIANGHVQNGIIPNVAMVHNGHVGYHNGHIPNGGVPVILNLRTNVREDDDRADLESRRRRRRRKNKRRFQRQPADNTQSDSDGGIDGTDCTVRHGPRSHTPTLATTPESPESQVDIILEYEEAETIEAASESPDSDDADGGDAPATPDSLNPSPGEDEDMPRTPESLDPPPGEDEDMSRTPESLDPPPGEDNITALGTQEVLNSSSQVNMTTLDAAETLSLSPGVSDNDRHVPETPKLSPQENPYPSPGESADPLDTPETLNPLPLADGGEDGDPPVSRGTCTTSQQSLSPDGVAEGSAVSDTVSHTPCPSTFDEAPRFPRKNSQEQSSPSPDSTRSLIEASSGRRCQARLPQSYSTPLRTADIESSRFSLPHSSTGDLPPVHRAARCTSHRRSSAPCYRPSHPCHTSSSSGSDNTRPCQRTVHCPHSRGPVSPTRRSPPSQSVSPRHTPSPHGSPRRTCTSAPGGPCSRHLPSPHSSPRRTPPSHSGSTPCQSPSPHRSPLRTPSAHTSPRHTQSSITSSSSPLTTPSPHSSPRRAPPHPPPEVPPPAYEEALTMRVVQEGSPVPTSPLNLNDELTELSESPRTARRRYTLRCMETSL